VEETSKGRPGASRCSPPRNRVPGPVLWTQKRPRPKPDYSQILGYLKRAAEASGVLYFRGSYASPSLRLVDGRTVRQ
jgi:hypothetical protein